MTAQTGMDAYQRGVELAEAGKHEAALNCMREHLRGAPHDAQALNDTGAILHCLGRSNDAVEYLRKAHQLQADSGEIVWNLVEAYLATNMASEAASLFGALERAGILSIEVLNRTATMLLDQDKKGEAVEVLLRSFQLWPEQEVLTPILEIIRSRRPKIAFFRNGCGDDGILADACTFIEQRFQAEFYNNHDSDDFAGLIGWSDIAWFDGGGDRVVEASKMPRTGKTIVSLRRSDIRGDWVKAVRWEQVDILVQIGSSVVEEALLERVPDIRNRTRLVVVPNGINLDRYISRQRPQGKNLACMGCLSMEANPAFLLQCIQKLQYLDGDYRLFFSGRFESPVLEQYVRHMVQTLGLTDIVSFEPYPADLNAWLSDKHFVVSSGIGEGQVEAVLTGMACGLKPVLHNFPGAERLFPAEYLFNIAEEFCDRVRDCEYEPTVYRRFVEDRYAIAEQLERVNSILIQLETEIDQQSPTVSVGCRGVDSGISLAGPLPPGGGSPVSDPVSIVNP